MFSLVELFFGRSSSSQSSSNPLLSWEKEAGFDRNDDLHVSRTLTGEAWYSNPSAEQIRRGIDFFSGILPAEEAKLAAAEAAWADLKAKAAGMIGTCNDSRYGEFHRAQRRVEFLRNAIAWCQRRLPIEEAGEKMADEALRLLSEARKDAVVIAGRPTVKVGLPQMSGEVSSAMLRVFDRRRLPLTNIYLRRIKEVYGAPYTYMAGDPYAHKMVQVTTRDLLSWSHELQVSFTR